MTEKEHRFTDLKPNTEDFESQMPIVERYRRMNRVWRSIDNIDQLTRA